MKRSPFVLNASRGEFFDEPSKVYVLLDGLHFISKTRGRKVFKHIQIIALKLSVKFDSAVAYKFICVTFQRLRHIMENISHGELPDLSFSFYSFSLVQEFESKGLRENLYQWKGMGRH